MMVGIRIELSASRQPLKFARFSRSLEMGARLHLLAKSRFRSTDRKTRSEPDRGLGIAYGDLFARRRGSRQLADCFAQTPAEPIPRASQGTQRAAAALSRHLREARQNAFWAASIRRRKSDRALRSDTRGTVVPHSAAAANALGSTTQVPTKLAYLTSGKSRRLKRVRKS